MTIRVRFAPSPTGNVHIGNIRVAIFNWLLARNQGGKFLLRIEDTDRERSTPEAIQTLLDAMEWMRLDYDEEPLYQSAQYEAHTSAAGELINKGHASCAGAGRPTILHIHAGLFTPEFVSEPREDIEVDLGKGRLLADTRSLYHEVPNSKGDVYTTPYNWDALADLVFAGDNASIHDGAALRDRVRQESDDRGERIDLRVVANADIRSMRFRRRYVFFHDLVLGLREKPLESLRDQVIVRSDGSPVFHLANVLDDISMQVTHICRGNDHVENTFRHLFLYQALEQTPPLFAHFPMIVNAKGKPYSKRDGDAYVGDFRARGIMPEVLFNFLALCGWSTGDDREIMTREEMIEAFDLKRVNSAPAQFNLEKLTWMNSQYLRGMPPATLAAMLKRELQAQGLNCAEADETWMRELVELHVEHAATLPELTQATQYFFLAQVELQEKAVKKVLIKKEGAGLKTLARVQEILQSIDSDAWSCQKLEEKITAFNEANSLKMGDVAQPLRVAVTGGTVSRGIFEVLALLGREKTLARIARVLDEVHP